jgi:thiol-disulfide isomerase/thioredoxin
VPPPAAPVPSTAPSSGPLPTPVPSVPPTPATSVVPTVVPSCVLTGQVLVNFALNDIDGQPWEFRKHSSRLTLIDFWGTWCTHCVNAVPHLKLFQEYYGNYGLQVVGIAYEDGTLPEQMQKVNRVRQRLGINYPLLLGGDTYTCPVRTQFNVKAYPTLVLVDETGRIIWRGQGLDKQHIAELDQLIRQRLGIR